VLFCYSQILHLDCLFFSSSPFWQNVSWHARIYYKYETADSNIRRSETLSWSVYRPENLSTSLTSHAKHLGLISICFYPWTQVLFMGPVWLWYHANANENTHSQSYLGSFKLKHKLISLLPSIQGVSEQSAEKIYTDTHGRKQKKKPFVQPRLRVNAASGKKNADINHAQVQLLRLRRHSPAGVKCQWWEITTRAARCGDFWLIFRRSCFQDSMSTGFSVCLLHFSVVCYS